MKSERILILEPYYGGSHQQFIERLTQQVRADYLVLRLPARKWKMRMQLAAPWFARQLENRPRAERHFEVVLASSFVDLAVFKALAEKLDGWNSAIRYCLYFHENQFQYPDTLPHPANHQFTAINFTSALTADRLGFNSSFNQQGFLEHCRTYLDKAVDIDLRAEPGRLRNKSRVLYPGIDFEPIDAVLPVGERQSEPVLVWNHRWEHDKGPEIFFETCYRLQEAGVAFKLAVLGQSFRTVPDCFQEAEQRLGKQLIQFGYIAEKSAYYRLLAEADLVVSTAYHEFFGIAVLEAVRAGCYPVLPDRLSYPELFEGRFLYPEGGLYQTLYRLLQQRPVLTETERLGLTRPYSWETVAGPFAGWLYGSAEA